MSRATKNSQHSTMLDDGIVKLLEDLKNEMKSDFKTRFDAQEGRFLELKSMLIGVQVENTSLRATLDKKEREISGLRRKTNDNEQYMRSWSIRILDLAVPRDQDASNPDVIMRLVFNKILLPIFEGAVQRKILTEIPSYDTILETAHILPSKPNQTAPIIARFFSRNIKSMVFRLKKDFATRQQNQQQPAVSQPGTKARPARLAHPFYEDLTTANFQKMRAIASDKRVLACWSVAGQLRFRLHGVDKVAKVANIYSTVEDIIAQQK